MRFSQLLFNTCMISTLIGCYLLTPTPWASALEAAEILPPPHTATEYGNYIKYAVIALIVAAAILVGMRILRKKRNQR
ncbi:hypothetical protein [Pasteuria penetrans]|uniref:hypothetical protein n=1 Tax=Pasteuria penetrans TaxID=86005 RepID=UPI000F9BF1C6|nr:hypothetical protein [Pasteuria penetrans]